MLKHDILEKLRDIEDTQDILIVKDKLIVENEYSETIVNEIERMYSTISSLEEEPLK